MSSSWIDDPRLKQVSSESLCDAMDRRFDQPAHLYDLRSPTPERRLFGPAATIRFVPVREDRLDPDRHDFDRLMAEAIPEPAPGQVLVLGTAGRSELAIVGGNKAARMQAAGVEGLLGDCRFRDFDEIAETQLAAWCWGTAPQAGSSNLMPIASNVPVAIDGVTIFPGDHVYADRVGAVVIPDGHVDEVLEAAVEKEREDRAKREDVLSEG